MRPILNASMDPVYQAVKIKRMLSEVRHHVEDELGMVDDPRFDDLLRQSDCLLRDLSAAYERYESDQTLWRR